MPSEKLTVVMLSSAGLSSRIMYNALASDFNVVAVIQEKKPSRKTMLLRRARKLGAARVAGQLLFMAFDRLFLQAMQRAKVDELLRRYGLDVTEPPAHLLEKVESVNSAAVIDALQRHMPDAVVVNGTRIIAPAVLSSIDRPFLNTHVGITPRYRGVHGGYWALAQRDAAHCGVTVHLVDPGIDTGAVLYQAPIRVESGDGFNTYPVHQIAAAIPLMKKALNDVARDTLRPGPGIGPSKLWSHPTLFEYLKHRILSGVA